MALTAGKNREYKAGVEMVLVPLALAANEVLYEGAVVAVNAAGWAKACDGTAADKAIGIYRGKSSSAKHGKRDGVTADNTGGSNGDIVVEVETGIWRMTNAADGDALVQADIGTAVYADDDDVVSSDNTKTPLGKLIQFADDGSPEVRIDGTR